MSWAEVVDAAVMGTGRGVVPSAAELAAAGLDHDDDQARLLNYAAAMSRARRAGFRPPRVGAGLAPAPADEDGRLPVSLSAERRLAWLLQAGEHDLAAEWLRLLAAREPALRPPDVLLPALLTSAATRAELRAALLPVLGPLAGWLARRNDEWAWARDAGARADAPDVASAWETGGIDDRRALLARLRAADPAAGRNLVAATWAADPYRDRAAFVALLATGLSLDDEPLAERALADRRAEVRRAGADLLARLPGSHYSQRAAARAAAVVAVERQPLGLRLTLSLPQAATQEMLADGVDGSPPGATGVQGWLLRQIVAAAPASCWAGHTGLPPGDLLTLADRTDWSRPLRAGWTSAAVRDGDQDWLLALLDQPASKGGPASTAAGGGPAPTAAGEQQGVLGLHLLGALPAAAREDWLCANPGSPLFGPALHQLPPPWSARLSDQVRTVLASLVRTDPGHSPWPRALLRLAAVRLEPPAPPELDPGQVAARLVPSWDNLLSTLSVRAAMRRELAEEPTP
jgi:uncharacterized protein DUF5691